jgi:hypothetical protein
MKLSDAIKILSTTQVIPAWTSMLERAELLDLASQVREGGLIVEIGGLYGAMTAVLGLANPSAQIIVVDNFSWSPIAERPASQEELLKNTRSCGVHSVTVLEGDSRVIGKTWKQPIDLLWIDGGHSYEFVRADLENFGPHAQVIALHDWDNPAWATVRQAVEDFIYHHAEWKVDHSVDMVVVLARKA